MFWELGHSLHNFYNMTFRPAMKPLFSSLKSAIGLLLAMTVLQTILCVICITGVENIRTQQVLTQDFMVSGESQAGQDTSPSPGSRPSETVQTPENTGTLEDDGTAAESGESENPEDTGTQDRLRIVTTALNSTSIFLGALILWAIVALTVYSQLTSSSADRNRYLWGLYTTFGAKKKKIRKMLKSELYPVLAISTLLALTAAYGICNTVVRDQGISYSFDPVAFVIVLLVSILCIHLVLTYEVALILRKSCWDLLSENSFPAKICHPRTHGKLAQGFSPLRYARASFWRLRKYYISIALLAAVPAVIWICLSTAAISEDSALSADIPEFTLTAGDGVSEKELTEKYGKLVADSEGKLSSVTSVASYPARSIDSFLVMDGSMLKNPYDSTYYRSVSADAGFTLACADQAFFQNCGFQVSAPKPGEVAILQPLGAEQYSFSVGSKVYFSAGKSDGTLRVIPSSIPDQLKDDLKDDDISYLPFTVTYIDSFPEEDMSAVGFRHFDRCFFLVCESDYQKLTLRNPADCRQALDAELLTVGALDRSNGSFEVRIPADSLTVPLRQGSIFKQSGTIKIRVLVRGVPGTADENRVFGEDEIFELSFHTLYINQVRYEGETVVLRVTPYIQFTVNHEEINDSAQIHIALGIPYMESNACNIMIESAGENLISFDASELVLEKPDEALARVMLCTQTDLLAIEAGIHIKTNTDAILSDRTSLLLETLYADNSFDLVCADSTTISALELEVSPIQKDSEAVLILPNGYAHNYALHTGDKIRIPTTVYPVEQYDIYITRFESDEEILSKLLANSYEFQRFEVAEIRYSDKITRPCVLLSPTAFSHAIGKNAPYVKLRLSVPASLDKDGYFSLRDMLQYHVYREMKNGENLSLSSTGNYLNTLLRRNANYSIWMKIIALLVPLTLPFIWYYPISMLYERRKDEFRLLRQLGKTRKDLIPTFFSEAVLILPCAMLTPALLCYPCMGMFWFITEVFELPLSFSVTSLTPSVFWSACLVTALCAALSLAVGFASAYPRNIKIKKEKKERSRHADIGSN